MRQMFDGNQILKVKDGNAILKGLTASNPVTITREQLRQLTENAEAIKFKEDMYYGINFGFTSIVRTGGGMFAKPVTLEPGNRIRQYQIVILENDDDSTLYDVTYESLLFTK